MGGCPEEQTIQAFVEAALRHDEAAAVERHVDGCDHCRRLLAQLGRAAVVSITRPEGKGVGVTDRDPETLAAGTKVGRYRIVEPLGKGGMGVVYAAHDEELDRTIALKLVSFGGMNSDGAGHRSRMLREARAIAKLSHPNAIAVYDVGRHDEAVFIAMELAEGGTLREAIARKRPTWREVLALYVQAGNGLAAAHEVGLVHRDFKPDNVLLGKDGRPRVADFGLARGADDADVATTAEPAVRALAATLTKTGTILGTPAYMSPEQMRGRATDARGDLFSFCVALYEGLYAQRPFEGRSFEELRANVESGRVRPPPPGSRVPAWLRDAVARGLRASPEERYASMHDLLAVLERGARRRTAAGVAAGAAALAIAGMATAAVVGFGHRGSARDGLAASTTAPPDAAPTAILQTDLPTPASTSQEAVEAYRRGLSAQRDGNTANQRIAFREATEKDPEMAEAWLRLAIALWWTGDKDGGRRALTRLGQMRDRLDDHDHTLFDACEPIMLRETPDWDEYVARLGRAVERFPTDSELAIHYGYALYRRGRWQEAVTAYEHALALDPHGAESYRYESHAQLMLGDATGALATAERCARACPTSTMCMLARMPIDEQSGECSAFEADGRQMALLEPASEGYEFEAEAIATMDGSPDTVLGLLERRIANVDAEYRDRFEATMHMRFDLWRGDFVAAEPLAKRYDELTPAKMMEEDRGLWPATHAWILLETGHLAEAGRVARSYLEMRPTWEKMDRCTIRGLSRGFMDAILAIAHEAGMPQDEFERRRAEWASECEGQMAPWIRGYVWPSAYAATSRMPADAKRALELLPQYEPLPPMRVMTMWYAHEGNVRLLAGDAAAALPLLERGAGLCMVLRRPFEWMRAQLALGDARRVLGDRAGACAAYAGVVRRWGAAKPRSVTAERAAARASALACPAAP